jgi:hypothetical protein
MSRQVPKAVLGFPGAVPDPPQRTPTLDECLAALGADGVESLPFAGGDVTAGSESELQAAVLGRREDVDLPLSVARSRYLADVGKRIRRGDTSQSLMRGLEQYLGDNAAGVWENSWVRLPLALLDPPARKMFFTDLRARRSDPASGRRSDAGRFLVEEAGRTWLRLPISYLLNLSLVDALAGGSEAVAATGSELVSRFLNDNTSPETTSLSIVRASPPGRELANENAKRFLLTHLLVAYANEKFGLRAGGQEATIFFSPHTPLAQKRLNQHLSDAFYRELFISPCLPWEDGEAKRQYMELCHQTLSRSHLNAVAKLCDAGILVNNLAVLPRGSDTSLANNGTHVSLGSRKLKGLLESGGGFTAVHEKYLGDLAIKILEHFLPLFTGTLSAAPFRLSFQDFHPERVLGYLPHQLDYTHLRMLWRRWKKKARNRFLGRPLTPFGPEWLDRSIRFLCRLRGDFVPDFRLLHYPVALMSTDESPALDGRLGNGERLKRDLGELGVLDPRMSLYLPVKLRELRAMGYSGFENRAFSQFSSFADDLAPAADLQTLLAALAFKYAAGLAGPDNRFDHCHVPDRPDLESERRQIFFAAAAGLPTFYVRADTPNFFLRKILAVTRGTRSSRRYRGYVRVKVHEYQLALLRTLRADAADLVEMHGLEGTLADLERRVREPETCSAAGKLTRAILDEAGGARSPFDLPADDFNAAAERHYRHTLRHRMLDEGVRAFARDLGRLEQDGLAPPDVCGLVPEGMSARELLLRSREDVVTECLTAAELRRLIHLLVLTESRELPAAATYLVEAS